MTTGRINQVNIVISRFFSGATTLSTTSVPRLHPLVDK